MNYTLNKDKQQGQKPKTWDALKRLVPLMKGDERNVIVAFIAIIITSASNLIAPIIIAHTVDTYIQSKNLPGVLLFSLILFGIFVLALITNYAQIKIMGGVGRRILFNLRNAIFNKLQELPVAFFNQNKTGDLISRINNDTDKLNMFFAQALMQFLGNIFLITGAGISLLTLNIRLGTAALVPALGVLLVTQAISGWVKRKNLESLQSLGGMSAEIQESLNNFKVISAFNRLDYFREKFKEANEKNFSASVKAGIANNIFTPIYYLAAALAQLIVLTYGITLISSGYITFGLLIGFLLYVNSFYIPLRQLASLWTSWQQALAALDRISEVLVLQSNLPTIPSTEKNTSGSILSFKHVRFHYPEGSDILKGINLELEPGKTYALVGPTGGGKTTTASLMARLYDPTEGTVLLDGKDIRSYTADERAKKIGFILQDPFLFTGTLLDNLFYGNTEYVGLSNPERLAVIEKSGLNDLLKHFERGLETPVQTSGETVSLGQRQLIAFVRAVLRKPHLLILDEATANIDTVTEQLLQRVLEKLPAHTTRVVIAHRLNTIANADEIFFVNAGEVTPAGSLEHAVDMLMHGKRKS